MNYKVTEQAFIKFLEQFDKENPKIAVKISHSYHVADLSNILAKRLNLNNEQRELLHIIGLLHDIGRFLQISKSGDYDDQKTKIDHGDLGVQYLFEKGHIKDFSIPKKYYHLVEIAIVNHNKLKIEDNLTDEELFFAKFIRDVDKIDIFRQNATINDAKVNDKIGELVKKAFYNHRLVDCSVIKNETDMFLCQLAYLFDINFKESYELLKETKNLELYLSMASTDKSYEKEFKEMKSILRDYLTQKIMATC